MGKPLTIQLEDDEKIELLKKKMGVKTKIDVVRAALDLLEMQVAREERVKRWRSAAKIVGATGLDVLQEFQIPGRFDKLP